MSPFCFYALRRIGHALIVLWLTYTVSFLVVELLPGDPIRVWLLQNEGAQYSPETIEAIRSFYGYDRPMLVRYFSQFLAMFTGQFGYSLLQGEKVSALVAGAAAPTILLAIQAILFALLISTAITIGATALAAPAMVRAVVRAVPAVLSSIPTFLLALVALFVLAVQWRVMPIFPDGSFLSQAVPALVLSISVTPAIAEVFIARVDDIRAQPFIATVIAKGATPGQVFTGHVLKNASGALLTVVTMSFGGLVSGAVVIETAFSRNGVGTMLLNAVNASDVALIQGFVLVTATAFVVVNLAAELLQPALDPRVASELEVRG